ncbi:MAG: hypothetical protein IMZ64_11515 [Bacteroidetes bacterium]|nr:hypothetical protein [Bacteroidota bacterium]MBE3139903.1 hypothetical protein [Thermoplasmata archaeon]
METEIINNTSGIKKTFIVLIIIFSAFIIYYAIMSMMSPARKLSAINNEFSVKPAENTLVDERIFSDSAYLKLLKEKAFLQSRIVMAETDSIYLTINLTDSTANIEISGVVVHKAKMSSVQTSKILIKGDENIILSMLSSPFTISNTYATIRKEPVLIKMAPKDTSEYKPDIMPDTSITEPVNYILEMTNGTRIYVYQEEKEKFSDRMNLFIFNIKDRLRDTRSSLKSVALFKVPEYHPFIKMRLPRADAKIIYRAIPRYGQVGIYR